MNPEKEMCIELNKEEYGDVYSQFRFPNKEEAIQMEQKRTELLETLSTYNDFHWDYNKTKYYGNKLSPGCRCCGEGTWSCLFINNICNGRCFFCPTPQVQQDEPATNTLRFSKHRDYCDYIQRFEFKGVSISGGEPLLTFDRTLLFLTEVKKRFGNSVYMWLYTNGILLDMEKLIRLKYTGLDEIRFDICAVNYNLEKVKMAIGKIPNVTVEIPSIPGDADKMKTIARQLSEMGTAFLNLHQLRCTPHNCTHLIEKNYTFLHGRKVTVMESELSALELLHYTMKEKLPLAVNYCSFVYKNRYQSYAPRRRYSLMLQKSYEDVTGSGFIRSLSIATNTHIIEKLNQLNRDQHNNDSFFLDTAKNRLYFNQSLLNVFSTTGTSVLVSYDEAYIRPQPSFRYPYLEIPLNTGRSVAVERKPVLKDKELSPEELEKIQLYWNEQQPTPPNYQDTAMDKELEIYDLERLRNGLNEYY